MGASPHDSLTADWIGALQSVADAQGYMSFERFMTVALYHPELGYYRRHRPRVGYAPGTDFYTASTSGAVFGELVCAAVCTLLGPKRPERFHFVEIGAEPGQGVLRDVVHPFASYQSLPLGSELALHGPCIVFSNELFDARPFRRFVRRQGAWREVGVRLEDGRLAEAEVPVNPPAYLPDHAPEGYRIDAPEAAERLASGLAREPWHGLFVAFDYGKSWDELVHATPQGTARAYHRHTQERDLLARPGDQDLTCHVCWDWLIRALNAQGFDRPTLQTQEAFFIKHAGTRIEAWLNTTTGVPPATKRSLMQLLHPAYLGQKFEVLAATREETKIALDSAPGRSLLSTL